MSAASWKLLSCAVLGLGSMAPGHAELERAALVQLGSSVIKIEAQRGKGGYSLGSGVVVEPGRVITNCHVTRDAYRVSVVRGEDRWPVRTQLVDAEHDLCLLQVPGLELPAAMLGSAASLRPRQPVTALGYTGGIGLQISPGDVVALHRMDGSAVIQSSNWFTSGASGGGLFNDAGELVGILTFRLRGGEAHYFAAPVDWVRSLLESGGPAGPVAPLEPTALAFWQRAADSQPDFLKGAVFERERRWGELESLAARWAETDAGDAEAWYLHGLALSQLERLPAARAALERSVQIESASSAAWFLLGEVCVRLKQLDRARLALVRLEALDGTLANELMQLIDKEKA